MSKLVVLIAIVVVVVLLLKRFSKPKGGRSDTRKPGAAEPMVSCSQCGVHLPVSESTHADGRYFCSEEHHRLFKP